jgi:hypothetical protein
VDCCGNAGSSAPHRQKLLVKKKPPGRGGPRLSRALKKGFTAIYGFTSDEQGIRHPMLEKVAPDVDETDALFMIGACSAFVSYLVNKARNAGLLK